METEDNRAVLTGPHETVGGSGSGNPRHPDKRGKPLLIRAIRAIFSRAEEPDLSLIIVRRRRFVMAAVLGTLGVNFLMFLRFFFPRGLYEPNTRFKIGYPSDFDFGVDTKFQIQYRIWVVRNSEGIFVISAICTHLGCTPDWKASGSSVLAMAAAMTRRESISKVRRRGPWTVLTSNSTPKVRS